MINCDENHVLTPYSYTYVEIDGNICAEGPDANYTKYDLFCLNRKLELFLKSINETKYSPRLIPIELDGRERYAVELSQGGNKIGLTKSVREKLQKAVDMAISHNPKHAPILSSNYSLHLDRNYPQYWLRSILPYLSLPPSLSPFIYDDTIYVRFNDSDDYFFEYSQLQNVLYSQIGTLYHDGAIVSNKVFANKWSLVSSSLSHIRIVPFAYLCEPIFEVVPSENKTLDVPPDSITQQLEKKVLPVTAEEIMEIANEENNNKTEIPGLFLGQFSYDDISKVSELEQLDGSVAEEKLYRDQDLSYLRRVDAEETGLYVPTWRDDRFAPDRVSFLYDRMRKIPTFTLKIPDNFVVYHYLGIKFSKVIISSGHIIFNLDNLNLNMISEITSEVHSISMVSFGRVLCLSVLNLEKAETYQAIAAADYPTETTSIYYTLDPTRPVVFSLSIPLNSDLNSIRLNLLKQSFKK
jgi:hypothetical protein